MDRVVNFFVKVFYGFGVNSLRQRFERNAPTHPTLHFHTIHGKSIKVEANGSIVRRSEDDYENAVVFSSRPILVNEVVAVKILQVTERWGGPLTIGFTNINPSAYEPNSLPPGRQLLDSDGYWMKGMFQSSMEVDSTIFFRFDEYGNVNYGIDGEEKDICLGGVNVSRPVWAVLEVYGSVRAIKLVYKSMVFGDRNETEDEDEESELDGHLVDQRVVPDVVVSLDDADEENSVFGSDYLQTPLNCRIRRSARRSRNKSVYHLSPRTPVRSISEDGSSSYGTPKQDLFQGKCIICVENDKTTAFVKCGHLCMCFTCAQHYRNVQLARSQSWTCPVCRRPVVDMMRIYQD